MHIPYAYKRNLRLLIVVWSVVLIATGGFISLRHYQSGRAIALPNGGAVLKVTPSSGNLTLNGSYTVDISIDTRGIAVAGVNLAYTFSSNLQYVSADTANSVFTTEVSPVTANGTSLTFARIRTDTGYTGSNGQVVRLVFGVVNTGTATLTLNAGTSEVIAYLDSSNIIGTPVNASLPVTFPFCVQIGLSNRTPGNYAVTKVRVEVRNATTKAVVAAVANLTSAADGKVTSTDAAFSAITGSGSYEIWVKADGYLAQKVNGVTGVTSGCVVFPGTQNLAAGDFNGDNMVTLADIVTIIQAYNNVHDATTAIVWDIYGGVKPTLARIIDIIRQKNTAPNGAT